MRNTFKLLGNFFVVLLCSGCFNDPAVPDFPVGSVEGYQPIYGSLDSSPIEFVGPRQLEKPGKIFVISDHLLINEQFKGIHVFDNSNPKEPVPLGFLSIPGNTEVAVKGNVLYLDHLSDLVSIDISDYNNIVELSRVTQEHWNKQLPPGAGRYFYCPDPLKGTVIGWELVQLDNPKCFR